VRPASGLKGYGMPTSTQRRPPPAVDGLGCAAQLGAPDRVREGDPANDPDDLATWFAVYLAVLLFSMLGLGGIWISYFAL
jgi:hypothetical protein